MPGYLSNVFGDGGASSQDDQQHVGAFEGIDIDVPVSVHTQAGGSYEMPDGTTHEWSSTHDLSADVSTHATLSFAVDTAEATASDF